VKKVTEITLIEERVPIRTFPGTKASARRDAVNSVLRVNRHHPRIADHPTSRLLLACPDQPGLIAAVSGFLAEAGRNIVDADQHSSNEGRFFMRMVFEPAPEEERAELHLRFRKEIAEPFEMDYRFAESSERKRIAIMASREDHCLSDLLWRWRSGELGVDLACVVSNHPDHADQVDSLGLPYHHVPVGGDMAGAERRILELLGGEVDLLVLARYMQILSGDFLRSLRRRRPLRPRPRARGQVDRRHRPLRDRRARRRPDHRPGRDPGQPSR
jgi:formyltetrahydrofolate deformylase